jgi:CorA-like Mg2+ transporter protein
VAIIFLPLSFFTSYFGMNLKGIQNTSKTERYFWSICGSVSLSIVVVTLIYAFRRNVASWFRNKFLQDNGTTREHHNTPPYTTQRNSMSAHGLAAQNKCGEHYKKATGLHSVVSNCSNRSLGAQPENVIELRGQDLGAPRASCSEG